MIRYDDILEMQEAFLKILAKNDDPNANSSIVLATSTDSNVSTDVESTRNFARRIGNFAGHVKNFSSKVYDTSAAIVKSPPFQIGTYVSVWGFVTLVAVMTAGMLTSVSQMIFLTFIYAFLTYTIFDSLYSY